MTEITQEVHPGSLRVSKFHRRTSWGDMDALEQSLRQHGLLQPIVVYDTGGGELEILAGVRRRNAAIRAGLKRVPIIVHEIEDEGDVIAIQLVENLQREDLHPLDEAELYELAGANGLAADKIAARHGKTRAHVLQRLQLCALVPSLRERYRLSELPHAVAFAASRIAAKLQEQAVDEILAAVEYRPETLAEQLDEVSWGIGERYMTALHQAPFDRTDSTLPPHSCVGCQHRSDAQAELFPELEAKTAYCLNVACFQSKIEASWERAKADAMAKGRKVVAAGKLNQNQYLQPTAIAGWTASGKAKTVEEILKATKAKVEPVLVRTSRGEPEYRYPKKAVEKMAKEYEAKCGGKKSSRNQEPADMKAERQAREEAYERVLRAIFDAAHGRSEKPIWRALLRCLVVAHPWSGEVRALLDRHELGRDELLELGPGYEVEARGYALELVARMVCPYPPSEANGWPEEVRHLAAVVGVDVTALSRPAEGGQHKVAATPAAKDCKPKKSPRKRAGSERPASLSAGPAAATTPKRGRRRSSAN